MVVTKRSLRSVLPVLRCLLLIAALGAVLTTAQVNAQSAASRWSTPVKLFDATKSTQGGEKGGIREPVVVADRSGLVHVFWSSVSAESTLLYYTRLEGAAWTTPVDIETMPNIHGISATVDKWGRIHLIWTDSSNALFYSSAPLKDATSARGWTRPRYLADTSGHGQITTDDSGHLHLAYPERGIKHAAAVKYLRSIDGGQTWAFAVTVADTSTGKTAPEFVRLAISDDGILHIVWTEFQLPSGWPPVGVFYARSTDGGKSWSVPLQVAEQDYTQINVATFGNNVVHLAWNGDANIRGRYHKWSSDAGITWSEMDTVFAPNTGSGSTGPPSLGVDSSGKIHLLTNLVLKGRHEGTVHTSWDGQHWVEPMVVSELVPGIADYNEASVMALSQGNRLHVVFWEDEKILWYSTVETSSSYVEVVPFINNVPRSIQPLVSTPSPAVAPTVSSRIGTYADGGAKLDTDSRPGLTGGIIAAFVVVVVTMGFAVMRRGLH